jgi:hypothetical protein
MILIHLISPRFIPLSLSLSWKDQQQQQQQQKFAEASKYERSRFKVFLDDQEGWNPWAQRRAQFSVQGSSAVLLLSLFLHFYNLI